ncbi:MAG: leucine-rich repeat protein [Oscillospiraceae bacterium]|nr:leucine-rich repeat protein [Oscillospiraceae bacterium]
MKKLLSIILTLSLLTGLTPALTLTAGAADGTGWTLDPNGTLTIFDNDGMADWLANGRLTSGNIEAVITVFLEDDVTYIGEQAFMNCVNLIDISSSSRNIHAGVTTIGDMAFLGCESLEVIFVDDNNPNYEDESGVLFDKGMNTLLVYPEGKVEPEYQVPFGVTTIGYLAFAASKLAEIRISESVTEIGNNAFINSKALTSVVFYPPMGGEPGGVETIGDYAFYGCISLEEITIPYTVKTIGDYAFTECEKLANVTIGDGVTNIGNLAFADCSLENIVFEGSTPPTTFGSNVFLGASRASGAKVIVPVSGFANYKGLDPYPFGDIPIAIGGNGWSLDGDGLLTIETDVGMTGWGLQRGVNTELVPLVKTAVIKEGVTSITEASFNSCVNLDAITIPDTVTLIDRLTFYECTKLTSIALPDGLITIEVSAFEKSALTSVVIPDNVTTVGSQAFADCVDLESVSFGAAVNHIGSSAFVRNEKLTTLTFKNPTPPTFDQLTFAGIGADVKVHVPVYSLAAYTAAFAVHYPTFEIIEGNFAEGDGWTLNGEGLLTIEPQLGMANWTTHRRNSSGSRELVTEVEIKNGVHSIIQQAFADCINLIEVNIPESATDIDSTAFNGTSALREINVSSSNAAYSDIDGVLFSKGYLQSLLLYPSGRQEEEYAIPAGSLQINTLAFADSQNLKKVNIHDNVEAVYPTAFIRAISLTDIKVSEDNPNYSDIDGVLFNKEKTILFHYPGGRQGDYLVPDGVLTIHTSAFDACVGLTKVILPDSVQLISDNAFRDCIGLTTLTFIGATPPDFGNFVFSGVSSSGTAYVPFSSKAEYLEISALEIFNIVGVVAGSGWSFSDDEGKLIIDNDAGMNDWIANGRVIPNILEEIKIVEIKNGVTFINEAAFYNCVNLASVNIPTSVMGIDNYAFHNTKLFNKYADWVVYVDDWVVGHKGVLHRNITLRNGTRGIATDAFAGMTNLTKISFKDATPPIFGSNVFGSVPSSMLVFVPLGAKAAYEAVEALEGFTIVEGDFGGNGWELLYDDGKLVIYRDIGMEDWAANGMTSSGNRLSVKTVEIKEGVTEIAQQAFHNCTNLTSVIIPDSVTVISLGAFAQCSALTSISLPEGLESIGEQAFVQAGLTEITIPDSVMSIGSDAFSDCHSLTSAKLPNNPTFTIIESSIFRSCTKLSEIIIPNNVIFIRSLAFAGTALTEITIPDSVAVIEGSAFSSCVNLTSINFERRTTFTMEDSVFHYVPREGAIVTVPSGTKAQYEGHPALTGFAIIERVAQGEGWVLYENGKLVIDNDLGLENWLDYVRSGNPAIRSTVLAIEFKDDVTNIPDQAFDGYGNLLEIIVAEDNPNYKSIDGVVFNKNANTLLIYPPGRAGTYKIPDSVLTVGMNAFIGCENITAVIIPEGVTTIESAAFLNCINLESVNIPTSVTTLEAGAFLNTKLYNEHPDGVIVYIDNWAVGYKGNMPANTVLTIKPGTRAIADRAFQYKPNLTAIVIPDSVTMIGDRAFLDCVRLKTIVFKSATPPIFGNVFGYVPSEATIYVPVGAKAAYEAVEALEGLTIVEGEPFFPCSNHCKGEGKCDEPCILYGDCNQDGKINIADLTYLKYAIVKQLPPTPECFIAGDSTIGAEDIGRLRNYLTRKSDEL